MNKKFGAFSSSEDPQKLADTVKGIIIGLSAFIIWIFSQFGISIGTEEITLVAINLGAALSAIITIYGIIKKIFISQVAK